MICPRSSGARKSFEFLELRIASDHDQGVANADERLRCRIEKQRTVSWLDAEHDDIGPLANGGIPKGVSEKRRIGLSSFSDCTMKWDWMCKSFRGFEKPA